MGLYDRDYYRRRRPTWNIPTPRTVVGVLLVVNLGIYLLENILPGGESSPFFKLFALSGDVLTHPLHWYQFLTYGFLHAIRPEHVLMNMFGLWMFGRELEELYGKWEFLRIYLLSIIMGGLAWAVASWLQEADARCLGASGGVVGIVILFACHFPRRELALFFVIPVPAWIVGVLLVAADASMALSPALAEIRGGNVAYLAHLGGAAFAFAYYKLGWNFGRLLGGRSRGWWQKRPKVRIHKPPVPRPDPPDPGRDEDELDRILQKISREGEASLTRQERRILQDASRRYQKRRHDDLDE